MVKNLFITVIVMFGGIIYLFGQSVPDYEWEYFGPMGIVNSFGVTDTTVWVGTDVGLTAYFPISQTQEHYFSNNTPMFLSNINTVYLEDGGGLWLGSVGFIYYMLNGEWTTYGHFNSPLQAGEFIKAIARDTSGNMWFASAWRGMHMFDGVDWFLYDNTNSPFLATIKKIVVQPDNTIWFLEENTGKIHTYKDSTFGTIQSDEIGMNWINDMAVDSNGDVWVVGDSVFKYISSENRWENQHIISSPDEACTALTFDNSGKAWFWLRSTGLISFDGNQIEVFGYFVPELQYQWFYPMESDRTGNIWLSSADLYVFNQDTIDKKELYRGLPVEEIIRITENADGTYWMAARNNIYSYDGNLFSKVNIDTMYTYFNTNYLYIEDMESDSRNNRWLLVEDQIVRTDGNQWEFIELDSLNLPNYYISDIEVDSLDRVWAGFVDLVSFDGERWQRHGLDTSFGLSNNSSFLSADQNNNLWLLNDGDLYKYDGQSASSLGWAGWTLDMAADKQGRIWLAPDDDGVEMFDGSEWHQYYPCSEVVAVGPSFDTTAWVGCYGGDLFHYRDGIWEQILMEDDLGFYFGHSPIEIMPDSKRNIWITYENFGVIRLRLNPPLSVDDHKPGVPTKIELYQNYPNPFNNQTTFSFYLPEQGMVELHLYNLLGQHVGQIFRGQLNSGYHSVHFNASQLPSGVYLYQLQALDRLQQGKMILLK